MSYIRISDLQILETQDIIKENPNVSFPNKSWTNDILNPFGYAELKDDGVRPSVTRYQRFKLGTPENRKGEWYKTFIIEDMSPSEIESMDQQKKTEVLSSRNQLLVASDWTQLPDVALTDEKKLEWAEYRQKLRDITTQDEYPWKVNWPYSPK